MLVTEEPCGSSKTNEPGNPEQLAVRPPKSQITVIIEDGSNEIRSVLDTSGEISANTPVGHKCERKRNSSSGSDVSSSTSTGPLPTPPDGGWGWVVVAASFVAHCIADGCAFSFGIFYMTLKDAFNESDAKTSLVGSIFAGVPLMAGPIASAITNKYGCRSSTIMGTFLAMTGFCVSYFATSLNFLIVSLGLVSGLGFSLIYMSAIVIVAFYFEKKRALATGIAVSGTGIGTMIFAPMCELLIEEFGWRGTFLLIGGIVANTFVCGAVFRPNEFGIVGEEDCSDSASSDSSSPLSCSAKSQSSLDKCGGEFTVNELEASNNKGHTFPKYKASALSPNIASPVEAGAEGGRLIQTSGGLNLVASREGGSLPSSISLVDIPTHLRSPANVSGETSRNLVKNDRPVPESTLIYQCRSPKICVYMPQPEVELNGDFESARPSPFAEMSLPIDIAMGQDSGKDVMSYLDPLTYRPYDSTLGKCNKNRPKVRLIDQRRRGMPGGGGLNLKKDTFYRGSLFHDRAKIGSTRSCPDIAHGLLNPKSEFQKVPGGVSQPRKISREDNAIGGKCCASFCNVLIQSICCTCCNFCMEKLPQEFRNVVYEMLDISLFLKIGFLWFCMSNLLLYAAYDIPYYYVPEYAVEVLGIEETKASFLISIIGIVSTLGQVAFGWFGDLPGLDVLSFYSISLSVCGTFTIFIPFFNSYTLLVVYCSAFGFFISANYALSTIILVDIVTLDRLTNAYGLLMFAQGLANMLGPPFAGFLSDTSGSHILSFYVAGSSILLSGLMLFLLRPLEKLKELWARTYCCQSCNNGFKKAIARAICCGNPDSNHNANKSPLSIQAQL